MQLMTVSAAARHLGYKSRSQLYKLMNDGWLDAHVHIQMPSGQRLLDVDGLQKTLQGLCQWHADSIFLKKAKWYWIHHFLLFLHSFLDSHESILRKKIMLF